MNIDLGDTPDEFDRYQINQKSQPMHVFIGGADEAPCGTDLGEANGPGHSASSFPASNWSGVNSLEDLHDRFTGSGHRPEADYCDECTAHLAEVID